MHKGSISERLTWMNMLVSGIALLLACLAFMGYNLITFRRSAVENLSTQAQMIGANTVSALLFNDSQSAENTLSILHSAPNVVSATIYSPDGKPFVSYQRQAGTPEHTPLEIPQYQLENHRFGLSEVELARVILFKGQPAETVYIESDLESLYARLERYAELATAVLIVSLLAAFSISGLFQRAISKPLTNLAETARIISRDRDYSVRAMLDVNVGELAVLTQAFNEMLVQIQHREKALRDSHEELEDRVRERTTQLAATNQELESFSYSVSHDLRAPLRSIDGFSQALIEDYGDKLDANGQDCLRRVRAATQRMSDLIDDMLNLSRVTRSEMRKEKVDLSALAASVVRELRQEQPRPSVEVVIENDLVADGDAQLLRITLQNLLGNAWKYTSAHPRAKIEFGRHQNGGEPAYFVRDDGAGFDPAYTHRLFGAFQRLHGVKEFPGTGIGLATVQRIIRRHGGKVWAEGAVEKGATFYFTI